jgi:membrane protease YdiL (CAAX protease family)
VGAILTTTWFSMVHGIAYDSGAGLEVYWVPMLTSGLAGFVFAWIRERSGSVVPAIASHNFSNTVLKLLG